MSMQDKEVEEGVSLDGKQSKRVGVPLDGKQSKSDGKQSKRGVEDVPLDGKQSKRVDGTSFEGTRSTATMSSSPDEEAKDIPPKKAKEKSDKGERKGWLARYQDRITAFCSKHKTIIKWSVGIVLVILFMIYLGFAMHRSFDNALPLFVYTIIICCGLFYYKVLKPILLKPYKTYVYFPTIKACASMWTYRVARIIVYTVIVVFCVIFLVVDTWDNPYRLVPLAGLAVYIIVCILFSSNPAKIRWRPVLWGVGLQFGMGYFLLRIPGSFKAFKFVSDEIVDFLKYAQKGTAFVYGFLVTPPNICGMYPVFAFTVLQTIIFFAAIIAVLYYYGIVQFILYRLAWLVQCTLDTTAAEALNAVACVFVGMTEGPLLIKPYMAKMTKSEINAMFTAGFACISGSLFAAYVSFGVCSIHIVTASFMSAPASIAVAKLLVPETEESQLRHTKDLVLPKSEERNVIEALSAGASSIVNIIWLIVANMIIYVALLHFCNNIIIWLGSLVGLELTFDKLMGYLFYPLAFIMGASDNPNWERKQNETFIVAQLMGTKTVFNEFIAYLDLGTYLKNNEIGPRAQMVATYALCGFSNLAGIGMQLGTFSAVCPEKRDYMVDVILRSLLGGSIACFMTACVAGIIVKNERELFDMCPPENTTSFNCTQI